MSLKVIIHSIAILESVFCLFGMYERPQGHFTSSELVNNHALHIKCNQMCYIVFIIEISGSYSFVDHKFLYLVMENITLNCSKVFLGTIYLFHVLL